MIITIALGVMLGLFLTGLVVRVVAEVMTNERLRRWLAWTFWIIAALIVVPLLPPDAIGFAMWAAVCLVVVCFVIALIVAVRRNGGWLPRDKDGRPRWW